MISALKVAGLTVFERGWLSSNNVLFKGDSASQSVLVDSGYFSHSEQTLAMVRHALGGRKLDRIVNTHLHSDHCGGNHALWSAYGCSIDVAEGEAAAVDSWDEDALSFQATGQYCPRFERSGVVTAGGALDLGSFRWEVIAAPGHDPRAVVLYQPDLELLITADALWENGFGVVFPEIEGTEAFDQVRQTLDVIRGLRATWIIPGHGTPFKGLESAIDRAERRLRKFVADPRMHAIHSAKVLIKFHMLEVVKSETAALLVWCASTGYLRLIHASHFGKQEFGNWAWGVISTLVAAGALAVSDGKIIDR